MYVFEGLSDGAMSKIEKLVPLDKPNDKNYTILKNKAVLF
jgi:hypothetical protein